MRFASDWGYPQFEDPEGLNYATVEASGQGKIRYRFDLKGYTALSEVYRSRRRAVGAGRR